MKTQKRCKAMKENGNICNKQIKRDSKVYYKGKPVCQKCWRRLKQTPDQIKNSKQYNEWIRVSNLRAPAKIKKMEKLLK